ncbi:MAG TPA: hypothetical protein VF941_05505 [Clostridia bacterium]
MKYTKIFLSLITSASMLLTMIGNVSATEVSSPATSNYTITSAYKYPILPGSSAWKKIKTKQELLDVLQIPNDILHKMSTDALVDTVLKYPFYMDIYCYNSAQDGFKAMSQNFNGFGELLSRPDVGESLIRHYSNMEVFNDERNISSSNGVHELSNLEILLGQKKVVESLPDTQKQKLRDLAYEKYSKKRLAKNIYGVTADAFYQTIKSEPIPNDIRTELLNIDDSDRSINAVGVNAPDLSYATVKTPKGTSVTVSVKAEMTFNEFYECNKYTSTSYPNATKIADPTNNYNCHSYAWYSASTSNPYWMQYPSAYMTDGSYSSTDLQSVSAGNKIYYPYGGHSGIVYYRPYGPVTLGSISVTSKWGGCGLMRHAANYCPYSTSSVSFWR